MENKIYNAAFGKTKAAFVLYERLQDDKKLSRRVTNILVIFNTQLNACYVLDARVAVGIANLIYKTTRTACDRLPDSVRSYTLNVVKGKFRHFINDVKGYLPTEKRINLKRN